MLKNLEAPTNHAKMKRHPHDFDEFWETMQSHSQPDFISQLLSG
jgi:hypothetical protein